MRHIRCSHCSNQLETDQIGDPIEQSLAGTQNRWHQVDHHFVYQSGAEILASDIRPAASATSRPPAARSACS